MVENGKIVKLLKTLTEIKSISKKEQELKEFVKNYLKNLGYSLKEGNYFIATEGEADLIVATHLDTVPIKREFFFDGKFAYGTGVCDAKASLTAMLIAAEKKVAYTMAFFDDEEEDGLGSKEFSEKWNKGKWIIIMEPTELKIANRHYGSFELLIEVKGKTAHGAYPAFGINAIEKTFEIFAKLRESGLEFNILKIDGGSDEYVIPDNCKTKIEIFLKPEEKLSEIFKKIKWIKNYGDYEVEQAYEGYISKEVHLIVEKALIKTGINPEKAEMRSWTDALNLKNKFDVVVFGPGELPICHTPEERIKIEDIEKTIKVLLNLNQILYEDL